MTMPPATRAVLAHFGSLRTTLAGMALLGLAVAAGLVADTPVAPALAVAIGLLALNLVAALVVHPLLRRQLPLLVAHMALLALVVLVALGRMTALEGRFELTQGSVFDGRLLESHAGRWHRDSLAQLAFRHDGFEIDYAPGRKRGATRNTVHWSDEQGMPRSAVIGDHRPLLLGGYRVYTSPNKGFAPLLTWKPDNGAAVTGAVHLPSYPANELRQSLEWTLPDGRGIWVALQFDENLIDPRSNAAFRLPEKHTLVIRRGALRAELAPGASLSLDGGTLVYEGLRSWMGYRVFADWTLPWLLASALLAALALAWHYTLRFFFAAPQSSPAAVAAPRDAAPGVLDA